MDYTDCIRILVGQTKTQNTVSMLRFPTLDYTMSVNISNYHSHIPQPVSPSFGRCENRFHTFVIRWLFDLITRLILRPNSSRIHAGYQLCLKSSERVQCVLSFSVCHAEQWEIKFKNRSSIPHLKSTSCFQRQAHTVGLNLEHTLFQKLIQETANMHF